MHDDRRGDAHIDPAACNRKIAKPIYDPAQRFVGADDPVRPAGCTCKNEYTPANPFTVCRGRYPHRPARRTRKIAPIMINCKNPNGFVGEGFYPFWRYNAANWDVPMRNGACCVVAVRHANLLMHRAWEGQSPSPAACRAILRFYDTRWQICRCTTGGQRRPPLQNVFRFRRWRAQFCDYPPPGRCGHRPLRTRCEVAVRCTILRLRAARKGQAPRHVTPRISSSSKPLRIIPPALR